MPVRFWSFAPNLKYEFNSFFYCAYCIIYDTISTGDTMNSIKKYENKEKKLLNLQYNFTKQIIKARKENSLSQQKLADQANVIRETIARIETGMTSPQIDTLIKILEPLGYTITITKIGDDTDE